MSISVGGLFLAVDTSPEAGMILAGMIAGVALAIGWVSGAVRLAKIGGPVRLPDDTPVLPFASILFGSFGFFVLAANVIAKAGAGGNSPSELRSALIACVPPLMGLAAIVLGDLAVLPQAGRKLGISARLIPRGIVLGLLASLIVLPALFFASELMEVIYKLGKYQHEAEHPMLRAMGESPSVIARALLVIGACVIVPIWEEAFFRGHLQTLLCGAFGRLLGAASNENQPRSFRLSGESEPALDSSDNPAAASVDAARSAVLAYESPPVQLRNKPAAAWMAVIITSAMFAVLHPLWTAPIIFLLSLGLGYAYERTGNLWVSIAMHAAFNSISTFWFLTHGAN